MFLLIAGGKLCLKQIITISIHLMFLLIKNSSPSVSSITDFNTSHVSINPPVPWMWSLAWWISIHLMFLLIVLHQKWRKIYPHISIHLMFLLIFNGLLSEKMVYKDFNTSHVSINQSSGASSGNWCTFQYISCFY